LRQGRPLASGGLIGHDPAMSDAPADFDPWRDLDERDPAEAEADEILEEGFRRAIHHRRLACVEGHEQAELILQAAERAADRVRGRA
jgi:hypothetical protein